MTSHVVKFGGGKIALKKLGTVNLQALASKDARLRARSNGTSVRPRRTMVPLRLVPGAARHAAAPRSMRVGDSNILPISNKNVAGQHGFDGITAAINGSANSPSIGGVGDVSPPDQGLAVGPSSAGPVAVEFVNDTLNIYSTSGESLLGAIPAFQLFGLPSSAFLSDPRAYWDPQTHHWFLTMFIVGNGLTGSKGTPSIQFIDVSQTTSPFGPYTTFGIDTTDSANTAGGCPCFGDYDQVGADRSGFFIATNEFSISGSSFNGSVIYAVSKGNLISAARGSIAPPMVQVYRVPFASDSFAAYHISPSTVTPGAPTRDTEFFVESNSNLNYGRALHVYALMDTNHLNTNGRPTLVETSVRSEFYSFPPNAFQKSGPFPYGQSVGATGVGQLQSDFNAVQEVTYAGGMLYGTMSTGFNYGTGQNVGAAWFVLAPKVGSTGISVTMARQGYVRTSQNLLYPVLGVNAHGWGYMAFAVAGPSRYPSAAYIQFRGTRGTAGPVHVAASGTRPLDDFTCYAPFSSGQCRYGDYSMAQFYNGRVYMATEYTAPQPRDYYSNWGTRVWSAPIP
ncbi:MAG: hypothetical protein ACYCO9_15355 [Streptosporangiaceae bacterium]